MYEATADLLLLTNKWKPVNEPEPGDVSIEAALVAGILDGNRDLFGRLYERYAPMVYCILLARVPRNDVEDLLQDIFLQALKKLHTLRDRGAFRPWVAMIARNRAIAFYRDSRETVELSEDLPVPEQRNVPEASEMLDVIRGLPDAYRETLLLRLVEGMTGPEIATCTGLTAASVRVNLHRGMKLLRAKVGVKRVEPTLQQSSHNF